MDRNARVDYASKEYWNERYTEEDHFEWISNGYQKQLGAIAAKIGRVESRILVVGCGNSRLSVDLRSRGFENITSTDFSEVCIKKQREMHPDMDWRVSDATDMKDVFPDSEFDVVVEKCTVDAFVANERSQWEVSDAAAETIHRVLKEISRVLRSGGLFLSLTFSQPHFRLSLYAKECYEWDVVDARTIAETESSAIAYYFYAMEKGKELNRERLVDMGLYIRNRNGTEGDEVASSDDEDFLDKIGCS